VALLSIHGVVAGYGLGDILHGVDLDVEEGTITCEAGVSLDYTTALNIVARSLPMEAGDVFGREGAAVGDELHGGWQRQMFAEQFVLLLDGGVAIAIAVDRMAKDGDRPLGIDDGSDAGLEHAAVAEIALGDVSGGQQVVTGKYRGFASQVAGDGLVIDAAEGDVRGVEVEPLQREFSPFQGPHGDGGHDGMALLEEGIQGTAEAVVVELLGGDSPEDIGALLVSPVGDTDQGLGMTQACGHQEREYLAMRELQLRIGWEMQVDEVSKVELLEQGGDQRQGPEVDRVHVR